MESKPKGKFYDELQLEVHPNWSWVMRDCGGADAYDSDLLAVSRYSLELALSALRKFNAEDAYHNYLAATREIERMLSMCPRCTVELSPNDETPCEGEYCPLRHPFHRGLP